MITNLLRVLAWALIGTILFLSLSPPAMRPVTGAPSNVEHLAMFGLSGLAFGLGYRFSHRLQATGLIAFCGAVEILQMFVPGRHARLTDFVIDAAASCVGVFIGWLLLRRAQIAA